MFGFLRHFAFTRVDKTYPDVETFTSEIQNYVSDLTDINVINYCSDIILLLFLNLIFIHQALMYFNRFVSKQV